MTALPASLATTPRLDRWVEVAPDGFVHLSPGKVEIGQGLLTALAQILAEELDISVSRIHLRPATTGVSPNEGVTSGSLSIRDCGMSVRAIGAEVRALFVGEAAKRFGVAPETLVIEDGTIRGAGNLTTSYWELANSVSLAFDATGKAAPKSADERRLTGTGIARLDGPGRVFATRPYLHDITLDGMHHGAIVRPPQSGAKLIDVAPVDLGSAILVRDGSFLGLVCSTASEARMAVTRLTKAAHWTAGHELPDPHRLGEWIKAQPAEHEVVAERGSAATGHPPQRRIEHHFLKSYLAHGSIAPSVAIATWHGDDLKVLSHTQGIYNLRDDLALVFGLPPERVTVEHAEGAGCYGHNGADDVALDAALLARAVRGTPVRVQWSRADELAQAPMGAAMAIRVAADLDETGAIVRWEHEIWGNGHVARPGRAPSPALLAGYYLAAPFPLLVAKDPALAAGGGGAQRNAVPLYDFPNWRIEKNRLTVMPLRTSSMRSLGAFGNVFAIESMMDEIARATEVDPLDLRLRYLTDDRARDVVAKAGAMAGWGRSPADGRGLGLGFARYKNTAGYCAVVAEVDVTLNPRVEKLWIAVDVGEAINPDGVINQLEGGAIQAVSWTLKEAVRFSRHEVESRSWETYPILSFSEVPEVEVALLSRPDDPPLGAGEAAHGPTAAAIGNAIASALGIRVTSLPLTRDTILQAMET